MSVQSPIIRKLIAISAALAMSSVAIVSTVGPAQAASAPVQATANA